MILIDKIYSILLVKRLFCEEPHINKHIAYFLDCSPVEIFDGNLTIKSSFVECTSIMLKADENFKFNITVHPLKEELTRNHINCSRSKSMKFVPNYKVDGFYIER